MYSTPEFRKSWNFKISQQNYKNHILFYNFITELQNHGNLIIPHQNQENQEIQRIPHPEIRKP